MYRFLVSQFWNFFLTSGAHTRKRTIASLRWAGSLLRGENGSRSECANRPHQGNAPRRVRSKKTFPKGRPHQRPPFFIFYLRAGLSRTGTLGCAEFAIAVVRATRAVCKTAQPEVAVLREVAIPRRKRWQPRLVPARGRRIHSRRICKRSRALRGSRPREYRRRPPE
jgi:hypothetical protein